MSKYAFGWRDRVADPDWLRWCLCGHAEQIHGENLGACTAGPVGRRCMCDAFTEKKREWVGFGDAPTPCVGWRGDAPCPVYGHEHGCRHPDGHASPKWHECPCGARARAWTERCGRWQPIYGLTDHQGAS